MGRGAPLRQVGMGRGAPFGLRIPKWGVAPHCFVVFEWGVTPRS